MKIKYMLLIGLVSGLASCTPYSTAPVAAHAGAGYVVGSGANAMAVSPGVSRHQAEAQKANSFFGGGR